MDYPLVLRELGGFFEREGVPFAVIGGMALRGYGLARATYDLDVATEAGVQEELIAFLESLGFETLHRSPGYSNHLHPEARMGRVDVVYVRGETSEELFSHVREVEVLPGVQVAVPMAEHLIAMKIHAMANDPTRRFQEMADIRHLMQQPGVDRARVREAFETRGLLDRYRELEGSLDGGGG